MGYGLLMQGLLKLGRGVDVFAAAVAGIGVPFAHLMAWITMVIELLGGVAVLVGVTAVILVPP
ncbi:MAG: DoxX family membrane protein [Gammaproteobacteria bacterium]